MDLKWTFPTLFTAQTSALSLDSTPVFHSYTPSHASSLRRCYAHTSPHRLSLSLHSYATESSEKILLDWALIKNIISPGQ